MNASFWKNRSVFVTGGTGFLGGWLIKKLLEQEASVVCLVRDWVPKCGLLQKEVMDKVSIVRGDVRDQALLERVLGEYEIETVFHLAAQTLVTIANDNPLSTLDTNIRGTWSLLEACRRSPKIKQVLVASSDKAYGDQEELPYHENAPLQGRHPYDVSKSCADLITTTFANTYDLPVVITRCGNFFGGGDLNWNRLVPGTIRSIVQGKAPIIRSDGSCVRDYFYIEDGVLAYLHLAETFAKNPEWKGEAFNFSNEIQITALDLVKKILNLSESSLKPDIRNEAKFEIQHQYLSAAKAKEWLQWSPSFELEEALRKSIDWYKNFLQH